MESGSVVSVRIDNRRKVLDHSVAVASKKQDYWIRRYRIAKAKLELFHMMNNKE